MRRLQSLVINTMRSNMADNVPDGDTDPIPARPYLETLNRLLAESRDDFLTRCPLLKESELHFEFTDPVDISDDELDESATDEDDG